MEVFLAKSEKRDFPIVTIKEMKIGKNSTIGKISTEKVLEPTMGRMVSRPLYVKMADDTKLQIRNAYSEAMIRKYFAIFLCEL